MPNNSSWLSDVETDLQAALAADDPSEKNYYIRAALQTVTVQRRDDEQ